jgi:hypothetical protein
MFFEAAFCIALYHYQGLPWWFGALAYGALAREFVRSCAILVKSIINSKE